MTHDTDDLRIADLHPLLAPAILIEELPVVGRATETVATARAAASAIARGHDPRLLAIVGPCSIHDPEAALELGSKMAEVAARLADDLVLVMRVYFEKPRTTVGWKGLINDPDLDGTFAINKGLRMARQLLLALADMGVPAGTELLDTITPQFVADLVSWGAIGARTTESQVHRELASGLSMPVGFKNGTDGSISIAIDAVRAARHPHHFLSVTKQGVAAIVATRGNTDCHVILRGSHDGPNYDAANVARAAAELDAAKLPPRVMIDCSHGNSGKNHTRQLDVIADVVAQLEAGSPHVLGIMLESHLVGGRQDHVPGRTLSYGQSITDACLAWSDTVPALESLAKASRARRARVGRA